MKEIHQTASADDEGPPSSSISARLLIDIRTANHRAITALSMLIYLPQEVTLPFFFIRQGTTS